MRPLGASKIIENIFGKCFSQRSVLNKSSHHLTVIYECAQRSLETQHYLRSGTNKDEPRSYLITFPAQVFKACVCLLGALSLKVKVLNTTLHGMYGFNAGMYGKGVWLQHKHVWL